MCLAPARIDRGRVRTEYTVREGDELVLPCPANGSPKPKLQFTRTGDVHIENKPDADDYGKLSKKYDNLPRHSIVSQVKLIKLLSLLI